VAALPWGDLAAISALPCAQPDLVGFVAIFYSHFESYYAFIHRSSDIVYLVLCCAFVFI
jgi:hypothetical protein